MVQCLCWGRGLIPTLGVYSAEIPFGKGVTVPSLLKRVLKQEVSYLYTQIKSHLTLQQSLPLWLVMMDDSEPTHERKKLVNKTYKNVLP